MEIPDRSFKQTGPHKTGSAHARDSQQVVRQDDKPLESRPLAPSNKLVGLQYCEIGQTLLSCEASCLSVGIPWFPPTSRVRKDAGAFYPPIDDFIRVQLCNVSTKTLESYCEDIASFKIDQTSSEALGIALSAPVERHGFSALVGFLLLLSLLSFMLYLNTAISTALGLSLGFSGCASLLASTFCGEQQRRESFLALLQAELLRRKGLNQSSNEKIKILSVDIEPL